MNSPGGWPAKYPPGLIGTAIYHVAMSIIFIGGILWAYCGIHSIYLIAAAAYDTRTVSGFFDGIAAAVSANMLGIMTYPLGLFIGEVIASRFEPAIIRMRMRHLDRQGQTR